MPATCQNFQNQVQARLLRADNVKFIPPFWSRQQDPIAACLRFAKAWRSDSEFD
jgi:hypothetical protein